MRLRIVVLGVALAAAACSGGADRSRDSAATSTGVSAPSTVPPVGSTEPATTSSRTDRPPTSATGAPTSTSSKPAPAPTTTVPTRSAAASGAFVVGERGAGVAASPGGSTTGRLRPGVALAVDRLDRGWAHVVTPCENHVWVDTADGRLEKAADVVLDPGHGGPESGAIGPGGLDEKDLNLAVAQMTAEALQADGVSVALARTGDYRQTLASRVAVAASLHPKAFVSIHHNAEPDEPRASPGTETYYQIRSADSKRLAGLVYEEVTRALSAFSATWVADRDAGAKYRTGDSGNDYYGILRLSAAKGLVGTLAELAFVSNPSEEALLRRDDVRRAEAGAVARGIVRYLKGEKPGDAVFAVPYPRTEPAGGGGGVAGCVDPS